MNETTTLKNIQHTPFSDAWWDYFLNTTASLNKTSVLKDCLSRKETAFMRSELMGIIRQLASMRTTEFGYRVFLDGKSLRNAEMEGFYDLPPKENESLEAWSHRCLNDRKFGLIINRGEKFSPELAAMVSKKIQPLLDKMGVPSLGITFTIFIGNYGWTPIGIHTDGRGENVLHFHLGKGGKTMYTWNPEDYEAATTEEERFNNKNVEKYLDIANQHPFGEGDLYFMPEGEYHIGRSDELSMGLTLWFNNHSKRQLCQKTMRVIIDQWLEENNDILPLDTNAVEDISHIDKALDLFGIPEDLQDLSFREFLKETYKDFRYSIYSNGAFWTRPFPREENFEFTLETEVQLVQPYQILLVESRDKKNVHLYIRGTKLVFNNHPCIHDFVELLNSGNTVSIAALKDTLDPSWNLDICVYLINSIYLYNGIRIID
ncbi:MAG: hypothetical protein CMC35_06850 [Flavobacteriaceae bacterium]|nr:hypothetical protein [Flavobacteriaceae bacterium]|tara:strand:- start:29502 stop:30794 length:1293 start_codon:yes stop_codon:yes gene_type:complete